MRKDASAISRYWKDLKFTVQRSVWRYGLFVQKLNLCSEVLTLVPPIPRPSISKRLIHRRSRRNAPIAGICRVFWLPVVREYYGKSEPWL